MGAVKCGFNTFSLLAGYLSKLLVNAVADDESLTVAGQWSGVKSLTLRFVLYTL